MSWRLRSPCIGRKRFEKHYEVMYIAWKRHIFEVTTWMKCAGLRERCFVNWKTSILRHAGG